jgi:hypothetical protein
MSIRSATPARDQWWRRPYLGVMVLFWAAPGGALLVGYLALPDHVASSQCGGTLFGCSITPKDGMVLLAVFVYPLVAVAGLLVMGVIAMVRAWGHRSCRGPGLTCQADAKIPAHLPAPPRGPRPIAESKIQARRCPTPQPCRPGECVATALRA